MTRATHSLVSQLVEAFRAEGRIVIVGASLAGLRAAEALREKGFRGELTIIGDEPHEPYDRPPLSKQVLKGWVPADHTKLPRLRPVDATWRLGVAAVGLDRSNNQVLLANGEKVDYDRLLIATGVRARPWFNPEEAGLQGLFTVRTSDDAAKLAAALKDRPRRVLIVGSGFIGSEIASVCRDLDLEVTVAERGKAPLVGALGGVIGDIAAQMQIEAGVDLRTGVAVQGLDGDASGHVRQARLSDGAVLDVDVVVASLGSIRNVEWLADAQLATGFWGVACDAGCRAFDINGVVTDNIFVAGDVARAPHVLYEYEFMSQEHWDNAVSGAEVAANNMITLGLDRRPHLPLPSFWSGQFGVNIKGAGVCSFGDEIVFTQGSVSERRFAAAYGYRGRIVGAVTFNHGKWLPYYASLIEKSAPFPPPPPGYDRPLDSEPMPARFPDPREQTGIPDVVLTGHDPTSRAAEFRPRA
ncbi:NADPH-dependent 2,4-dienoyl-CoA reductase/sulfur reductase-like enzyme [Mycolicibacterium sp. BK556]|uniref:NAD(P)/FAD-dependent oxidoreductase n=1 Tax=Mycobacteriaceae TaxID=1762 RepID=UPI00105B5244|nr:MULTISPECIES: FAD-dependent oxidoreductase [Mycobacteriaceae]MBB3602440.1 NADPH-dependent 2,4-dienoyl-CoA reductase/sulfur reductase-like enzyme [Mycolicibacterium sp. BK556]MBB3632192.1 NADPH-dependent 2,4-dienoyl-CoA reductase/sulfur reductase-like enzyme [Mycolicibacterium sp. BK607]TDO18518.1 NADPH-dependent 2,4-dienoyl-CoA reductase/sulfur reductase-like enzyme [Mycobacterium sp. BK086]